MGKNLDLLHCLLGSCQFFESPLNIHKMSQVICRHFWVGWPWENLPRLLSVWSSSDWLFFQSYGEIVNASCIPILLCQKLPSHTCVVFCSKDVSLCRPSQHILSHISWPSLVSSWSAIVPNTVW